MVVNILFALFFIGIGVFLVWLPPSYRERIRKRRLRLTPEAWDVPMMRGAGVLALLAGLVGLATAIVIR